MLTRREFNRLLLGCGISGSFGATSSARQMTMSVDEWISEAMLVRASDSPLKLQRFWEPIWVLLEPIVWKPSNSLQSRLKKVVVPKNFVTDLATIPRVFWSLMPRDGTYAYPAIVHDFLYWDQSRSKEEADQIFRWSMEDLEVSKATVATISKGVELFGKTAWDENAARKKRGEKRVLKAPPPSVHIKWADWKNQPNLFI